MNKFSNTTFIKELIDSDFIFSKSVSYLQTANLSIHSLKTSGNTKFNILDIFKLNRSLKQLIRVLYFLKENTKFKIYIWSSNKYLIGLTNKFIKEFKLIDYIHCSTVFPAADLKIGITNFLFVMGNPSFQNENKLINNRILSNDILIINKLNFKQERNSFGTYKIQNELSDYKKLLFLLVIIHNIIIKK